VRFLKVEGKSKGKGKKSKVKGEKSKGKLPSANYLSTVPNPPLFFFQGEGKGRGEVFEGRGKKSKVKGKKAK